MVVFFMAGHALIKRDNKYLVLQRSKVNDYMPLKWDIPGGIVEMGETIEQAIKREVQEETRLTINVGKVIHIYSNRDQIPNRQTFQAIYKCDYLNGEVIIDDSEHEKYEWVDYGDIAEIDAIDFLKDLLKTYTPK